MDPVTQILFATAATLTIAMLIYRVFELEAAERSGAGEAPETGPAPRKHPPRKPDPTPMRMTH